jgi:hypothetical protein
MRGAVLRHFSRCRGRQRRLKEGGKSFKVVFSDKSFDIGSDTLTGVNDADYQPPFAPHGQA